MKITVKITVSWTQFYEFSTKSLAQKVQNVASGITVRALTIRDRTTDVTYCPGLDCH